MKSLSWNSVMGEVRHAVHQAFGGGGGGAGDQKEGKKSTSFLKKRSKKLLSGALHVTWVTRFHRPRKAQEFFASFFAKKKALLPYFTALKRIRQNPVSHLMALDHTLVRIELPVHADIDAALRILCLGFREGGEVQRTQRL